VNHEDSEFRGTCPTCGQQYCGREIERLRAALSDIRVFLRKPEWGNSDYMEGSEIYSDRDDALLAISVALGEGQ
jgi:hypothetical protein